MMTWSVWQRWHHKSCSIFNLYNTMLWNHVIVKPADSVEILLANLSHVNPEESFAPILNWSQGMHRQYNGGWHRLFHHKMVRIPSVFTLKTSTYIEKLSISTIQPKEEGEQEKRGTEVKEMQRNNRHVLIFLCNHSIARSLNVMLLIT